MDIPEEAVESGRGRRPALLIEAGLLALLMAVVHFHLDLPGERLADLGGPDSVFYIQGARNLARTGEYTVQVNGQSIPPKFPPGISLLLAPWFAAWGADAPHPLPVMQLLSYLLCLGLWLFVRVRAGSLAAFLALLGWMAGGSFIYHRLTICTPLPDGLVLLALAALLAAPRPGRARIAATGLVLGTGLWVHYTNLAAAAPVLLLLDPRRPGFAGRAAWLAAGALPPAAGLLLWQWSAYGHPLATGYHLWLPRYHAGTMPVFSLDYALYGPAEGRMDGPNTLFYSSYLAGREGLLYRWPVAGILPLALAAAVFLRRRGLMAADGARTVLFTLGSCFVFYMLYSAYFYQGERLLCHLAPLAAAAAALGAAAAGRWLGRRLPGPGSRAGTLALLLLAGANLSLLAGNLAKVAGQEATLNGQTRHARHLARILPREAWVISDLDLLFLAGELPGRRILPLRRSQAWARPLAWRDWKRHRTGGGYGLFLAWYEAGDYGDLALTAPPAECSFPRLEAFLGRGGRVYLTSCNDLRRHPLLRRFGGRLLPGQTPPYTWRLAPPEEPPRHAAEPR